MQSFQIMKDATSLEVGFDPPLLGLGARVAGVEGTFDAGTDEAGEIDFGRHEDISGEFSVSVDRLELGSRLITYAAKSWLGGADGLAIAGRVHDFAPADGGGFDAAVRIVLKGREYPLSTSGRFVADESDALVLRGLTRLHPRDVGVPLPRRGVPFVQVRWTIALRPTN